MRGVLAFAVPAAVALAWLAPFEAAAGQGGVVHVALQQASAGATTWPPFAPAAWRAAAVAVLLIGSLLMLWRLLAQRALARNAPRVVSSEVDTEWLQRQLFAHTPELVGALYDGRIGGREVTAVLARMSAELKLASRVATGARGWNNLEMWLLVEREELAGYERELVERWFADRKATSGDAIRAAYEAAGFEPAEILRRQLAAERDALLGTRATFSGPLRLGLAASAVGLLSTLRLGVWGVLPVVLAALLGALGPLLAARRTAAALRRGGAAAAPSAWPVLVPAGVGVVAIGLLIAVWPSLPAFGAVSFALWGLVSTALVARALAPRESPSGLALRANLRAARQFFAAELEQPQPRILDEWLPYLIALELTKEVDHWYLAFGRLDTAARRAQLARLSALAPAAGSPLVGGWTGGAGAFGGVGASGAWIAATASLTVPPPPRRSTSRGQVVEPAAPAEALAAE
jgi:hypothetical protein